MPIYEYMCEKCNKTSEILVGVSQAKVEIKCQHCGSKKVSKKISSGFVSTGSKTKKDFCAAKGPCATPSCMYGGGCPQ